MRNDDRLTPARRQYLQLKRRHPDALLLYRMGDFYELFDNDAVIAARDLHITLTSREFGKGNRVPMAGIPYHALSSYLRRLLAKGHRVAICEQLSEPGRGLVERDVVRVLSPGTVAEPGLLPARENNYLVALCPGRDGVGLAYVDVSTGEFAATEFAAGDDAALAAELTRLAPAECLFPDGRPPPVEPACPLTACPPRWFQEEPARERLLRHFATASLEPFGCEGLPLASGAAAAALAYIEGTNRDLLRLLRGLHTYTTGAYVALDPHTRRNLELTRAARSGERAGSLLAALDQTRTAMGGRLLRRWLNQPLRDVAAINRRLDVVEALARDPERRAALRSALEAAGDLERLAGRARQGTATARDLLALAAGLRAAGTVAALAPPDEGDAPAQALAALLVRLDPAPDVADLIERAVSDVEDRPVRRGFDPELDELVGAVENAQATLLEMERREREQTGIRSLKVGFNKVFGYYIEVTRPNLKLVPERYIRRQTLANGERFVTPELKEWEARILRAEERIAARAREVFTGVVEAVGAQVDRLLATAQALAELDVLATFAELAVARRYTRPVLDDSTTLHIRAGRHPVVELALEAGAFVPNDTELDGAGSPRVLLVTGPNMAGKSTYLRQVALIVLLAQVGCFVPAEAARIGVADRIFTRIGAQDDLAAGASTFLVEMVETAAILRHATARSLLIFDEIGRGTSTSDGLAIAQAVVEDVHDRIRARTLFATHFHELTALAERLPAMCVATMAAIDEGGQVVFLRRLVPGGADRSYGIHVARLAGLPEHVTRRAEALLAEMERARQQRLPGTVEAVPITAPVAGEGCPACAAARLKRLLAELRALNLADTTPMQALNFLFELQQRLAAPVACTCGAEAARAQGREPHRPRLALVEPVLPSEWSP
jgi:DNA mismatch repair protein MutS